VLEEWEEPADQVRRDAERIAELAPDFSGNAYRVFEDELCRAVLPVLRGMLRSGTLQRHAYRRVASRGIALYVSGDDSAELHRDPYARDEIVVDLIMTTLSKFRKKALMEGGWDPERPDACSLSTYFIGLCIWEFRRVYLRWRKERRTRAEQEAALLDPEAFLAALPALSHLSEDDLVRETGPVAQFLARRPAEIRAVVHLRIEGYSEGEIAEKLGISHGAVRTRMYRLRQSIWDAVRQGQLSIPDELLGGGVKAAQR
jgi:hypothetical protein